MTQSLQADPESARDHFADACFPVLLVDGELTILFANKEASEQFPAFRLPDGLRTLLSAEEAAGCVSRVRQRKHFKQNLSSLSGQPMSAAFVPAEDSGESVMAYVFFVAAMSAQNDREMPLTSLLGYSSLGLSARVRESLSDIFYALASARAKLDPEQAEKVREQTETISRSCYRILRDMDNIARRGRAGDPEGQHIELVDFWSECAQLLEAASALLQGAGVKFSYALPFTTVCVRCDFSQVSCALLNIISNACLYSGPQATVRVIGRDLGSFLVLTVSDDGPGIPSQQLEGVFEPAPGLEKGGGVPGLGLGLNTARQIVTAMGGTMAVQSQEGSGTTVAFTFPAAVGEEPMDSTFSSDSSEYLQDRFSPVYVGLCGVVSPPLM